MTQVPALCKCTIAQGVIKGGENMPIGVKQVGMPTSS